MGGDSSSAAAAHVVVEKLEVVNAAGVKLVGILEEGRKRREELCILCHGFQSSKELPALVTIAAAVVQEAGMSSFRFDFTGNGESGGEFAYGNYWREVEDLRAVVEFWRARGRRIVALIGHSKGGNAVLLYASKYQDVGIIVNISGRFDLRRGIRGRLGGKERLQQLKEEGFLDVRDNAGNLEFRVVKQDIQERLSTDMHRASISIPHQCRVLTIHGSADELVPVEDAHEFAKRISNHVIRIMEGADHKYKLQQQEIASLILDFLQSNPVEPPPRASL
ncbi:hypothetical protein BDL97_09G050900 [Sphagnum fallax]|nr:hypothetical protein BDL97_09G050900 [Sphagnum fallax]